ncbi:hypothetical protein [Methylomonas sp. ZR1]|uniref:hypothetical protein n=1 Tax=Methylomonas sp. ZR1 TaxID=1797072 RepID=UPI001492A006|nr:hypothetical protein [Methylomonas sp. ZR1]NOV29170.1 hypothetical protein [Methylomonas sp. ZR1]
MATSKAAKAAITEKNPERDPTVLDAPKAPALEGDIILGSESAPSVGAGDVGGGTADTEVKQPAIVTNAQAEAESLSAGDAEETAEADKEVIDGPSSASLEDDGNNDEPEHSVLFVYWPNIAVLSPDGGFAFDKNGAGELTEKEAAWLAEQISAGNLPEPPENILPADSLDRIAMVRAEPAFDDGPTTADVHPNELVNWLAAGWVLAADQAEGA